MAEDRSTGRPLAVTINLVGFVSAIIALVTAPDFALKIWLFRSLGLLGVIEIVWWANRRWRRRSPVIVRSHLTTLDFDTSCALGSRIYTQHLKKPYPPRSQIDAWLDQYSDGVFQAFDSAQRCLGYFSLWPITKEAFYRLKVGELAEYELDGSMIEPVACGPFSYWYIADIVKDNRRFHPNVNNADFSDYLCSVMIYEGLHYLMVKGQLAYPFELISFAVTRPGAKLLKKYLFQHLVTSEKHEGPELYLRLVLTRHALCVALKRLRLAIRDHEGKICKLMRTS